MSDPSPMADASERFTPDTDDAPSLDVLTEVARCASHWVPDARLVGNVRAGDIVRAVAEVKSRLQAEAPTREQVAAEIYSAFPFPDNMRGPNSDACLSWEKAPAHAREVTYRRADAILALPGLRTSQAEAQAPTVTLEDVVWEACEPFDLEAAQVRELTASLRAAYPCLSPPSTQEKKE